MHRLSRWISEDPLRCHVLTCVAALELPDMWVAAGFVRNLAWDRLHAYTTLSPLSDIDVIYFNTADLSAAADLALEDQLRALDSSLPWSVKNQARMHLRNQDPPYQSSLDAMSYWIEVETALAARLLPGGEIEVVSPFTQTGLFELCVTPNLKRYKPEAFEQRQQAKAWVRQWPMLRFLSESEAIQRH
jgi:hypothetical protein